MLSRETRHRIAQRVFWSPPGRAFVRLVDRVSVRWSAVIMNRSLNMEVNGERWIASLLPANAIVLDVGFNRGDFSSMVITGRPQARCFGFDPAQSMRHHYETEYPHKNQVELVSAAVSNAIGECLFTDSANGVSHVIAASEAAAGRPTSCSVVPKITLDSFVEQRGIQHIDFIKIDAEGFDLHVLEGAGRLLAEQRAAMFMFEYNEPWIGTRRFLQEAVSFFADKPYSLFRLFNGFLVPFQYSHRDERHDLGCNYVGVSHKRFATGDLPIRSFP